MHKRDLDYSCPASSIHRMQSCIYSGLQVEAQEEQSEEEKEPSKTSEEIKYQELKERLETMAAKPSPK